MLLKNNGIMKICARQEVIFIRTSKIDGIWNNGMMKNTSH